MGVLGGHHALRGLPRRSTKNLDHRAIPVNRPMV